MSRTCGAAWLARACNTPRVECRSSCPADCVRVHLSVDLFEALCGAVRASKSLRTLNLSGWPLRNTGHAASQLCLAKSLRTLALAGASATARHVHVAAAVRSPGIFVVVVVVVVVVVAMVVAVCAPGCNFTTQQLVGVLDRAASRGCRLENLDLRSAWRALLS